MIPDLRRVGGLGVLVLLTLACSAPAAAQALPVPLDETAPPPPVAVPAPTPWAQLDAAGRADTRARYEAWRALSESERARLRQAQAQFAALPADQQQALRNQFLAMDRLHRDSWLLGPRLGQHYAALHPLFGFLPAAERQPALALLRSLDDTQLAQLAVIAQRTPPQERAALRRELLGLAPSARAQWLRAHAAG